MTVKKKPTAVETAKSDGYNDIFRKSESRDLCSLYNANATQLYIDDSIARRIIDVIPEEVVTSGFGVDGVQDEKKFKSEWDALGNNEKIICAQSWARLHGGSIVVGLIRDGRSLKSPAGAGKLEGLRVYDRHAVSVSKREENPRNARFGEPVLYEIKPECQVPYFVHYTRCHIFDGKRTTAQKRRLNQGWGESVLDKRLIEAIVDYNYCHELATQLLRRKQQAVWKAKGLALLCDDDEGKYAARIRLAQVDDNSGVGKAVGIDADDEEYDILNSDISGVDAFLEKKMDRIVSLSGIHEIILKNKNVGGVSSSQNTALETFYKQIERERNEEYRPFLEWLLPFMIEEQEWSIRFEPLSMPSEKDQAETLNKNVNSLVTLLQEQAIDVDECRDTLEAMSDIFKLKATAPVQEAEVEPEPGTIDATNQEGAADESSQGD